MPDVGGLQDILELSTFLEIDIARLFAIQALANPKLNLSPCVRLSLAIRFRISDWIEPAFDELIATPANQIPHEDFVLIGMDVVHLILDTQAAIHAHRLLVAYNPLKISSDVVRQRDAEDVVLNMPQNWTWVASYVFVYAGCCACGIGNSMGGTLVQLSWIPADPRSIAGACKSSNFWMSPLLRRRQADGRRGRRFPGSPSVTTSSSPPRRSSSRTRRSAQSRAYAQNTVVGVLEPVSGCAYLDPWGGSGAAGCCINRPYQIAGSNEVRGPAAARHPDVPVMR
jgi:hypothetical protein